VAVQSQIELKSLGRPDVNSLHVRMRWIEHVIFLNWNYCGRNGQQSCFERVKPRVADLA
jgi:hypothetical protein